MNAVAAAVVVLSLFTPGMVAPPNASAPLDYTGERVEWVEAVKEGDVEAVVRLGDHELSQGNISRAHAWFEYGARRGDRHAQRHFVWLQSFMNPERRHDAADFSAAIIVEMGPDPVSYAFESS